MIELAPWELVLHLAAACSFGFMVGALFVIGNR